MATFPAVRAVRALPPQTPRDNAPTASDVTVLRFGKLWDGSKVIPDAVVVVEGERTFTFEEMKAAVDVAHAYGVASIADASPAGTDGARFFRVWHATSDFDAEGNVRCHSTDSGCC